MVSTLTQKAAFVGLWLILVGTGFLLLLEYKAVPGPSGIAAPRWPQESVLEPERDRCTLVMVAHPRCPCTTASLDNLAQLLGHSPPGVTAYLLFVQPEDAAEDWTETDLWRQAKNIPSLTVRADPGGREAAKFGVATSGHCLLYHANGLLLYSGGITPARGHAGDCLGMDRLRYLLEGGNTASPPTAVFGCPLCDLGRKVAKDY